MAKSDKKFLADTDERKAGVAVDRDLNAMREVAAYLSQHPEILKQLAIEMKIHTKSGKLSKVYGG